MGLQSREAAIRLSPQSQSFGVDFRFPETCRSFVARRDSTNGDVWDIPVRRLLGGKWQIAVVQLFMKRSGSNRPLADISDMIGLVLE